MALLTCWLIFPAVLGVLSLGCGLLVERLAGIRIPGTLLLPVGVAVIIVAAQFAVWTDATAELATPAVVALAVIGLVLTRPWRDRRPDRWAAAGAFAVFAVFAAPIVLSGQATFAGYLRLDDTATWFALTDHVMEQGRNLDSLAPSSYRFWLDEYIGHGYPVGTFLPLGVGTKLVGQDVAWVFQPYVAFLAAMLSLVLYELVARLIEVRPLRAFAAFIAAQPAILFGYALVGGVKEVLTAVLLGLLVALVLAALRQEVGWRGLLPLAVVTAAIVDALSYGAAIWLLPVLLPMLVIVVRRRGTASGLEQAAVFTVMTAALSLAALPAMFDFLDSSKTLTSEGEFGTLLKPLSPLQPFGIWPVGDFRLNPEHLFATDILIVIVIGAALGGLGLAWARKSWELLMYVGAAGVGVLVISAFGAPWVDAKAFAIVSPAFLIAAFVGAAAVIKESPVVAALIAAPIAFGVLWSNVLAYHDVNLAPRDRLRDLEQIGERIEGEKPTLMTRYELYGTRHFLRKGDPHGAGEARGRQPRLLNGRTLLEGQYQDIDGFQFRSLLPYRSLVLDRSPISSRPPSPYRVTWRGDYYELWQRSEPASPRVLRHLPLGNATRAVARPNCRAVQRLARLPGTTQLAAVGGLRAAVINLSQLPVPEGWRGAPNNPAIVFPLTDDQIQFQLNIPAGRFRFWIGNAFRRRLELLVEGREIAQRTHHLQLFGQFAEMGETSLRRGLQDLTLRYGDAKLRPGSGDGGQPFPLGPMIVSDAKESPPVRSVRPSDARSLCRQRLDWVEAIGS